MDRTCGPLVLYPLLKK